MIIRNLKPVKVEVPKEQAPSAGHFATGVKGGIVYGNTFPDLKVGGVDDASFWKPYRGQWIPQFSSDQFTADLVNWLGLTPSEALAVMPNLANFPKKTIGFI